MTYTYPPRCVRLVMPTLVERGYAFRLDKYGLTLEWHDPTLTKEDLKAGINLWIEEDSRKRKRK